MHRSRILRAVLLLVVALAAALLVIATARMLRPPVAPQPLPPDPTPPVPAPAGGSAAPEPEPPASPEERHRRVLYLISRWQQSQDPVLWAALGPEAFDDLHQIFLDPERQGLVRIRALQALAFVDDPRVVDALAEVVSGGAYLPVVIVRAAETLVAVDPDVALPLLRSRLSDPDAEVRTGIAAALARIPGGDAALVLLEARQKAPDDESYQNLTHCLETQDRNTRRWQLASQLEATVRIHESPAYHPLPDSQARVGVPGPDVRGHWDDAIILVTLRSSLDEERKVRLQFDLPGLVGTATGDAEQELLVPPGDAASTSHRVPVRSDRPFPVEVSCYLLDERFDAPLHTRRLWVHPERLPR